MFNNWNVQFNPNNFLIEPGETQIVTVSALIPNSYEDGYYNLSFKAESEYNYGENTEKFQELAEEGAKTDLSNRV